MTFSTPDDDHFRAEVPEQLLETQRSALQIAWKYFAKIADEGLSERSGKILPKENDIHRPHRVFCIDGGRGSGKTYTLASFQHSIDQLSALRETNEARGGWEEFFKSSIVPKQLESLKARGSPTKSLAHVLRIIFPGDMEGGESLMECIFAAMMEKITQTADSDTKKTLEDKLRGEVAEGWYFAKRFGHEAIIRDSVDYKDYVATYERESRKAATRIDVWRAFIYDYLTFQNAGTLVVLLDDSDVRPELAQDILHSIRMFLNHPRIFTVLAGNIRSMRNTLLHIAMRSLAPSIAAFPEGLSWTAREWRQIERKAVEDYLEKVLPPAQRFFLRSPQIRYPGPKQDKSDFGKITGKEFREILLSRIGATREEFLRVKFGLALSREVRLEDRPSERQQRKLDHFLSWWVFANRYAAPLAPRSARQIATFGHFFADEPSSEGDASKSIKRLPVMLHDISENFTLIQRLGDDDVNITSWLRQQELSAVWVGQRMFRINNREIYQGGYSYDYIRYRLDVGMATPLRDNAEDAIPSELLPQLSGRRQVRRFFQPRNMPKQQRRYGVSRRIDHAVIPGNCAYFSDLAALPDISLISEEGIKVEFQKEGESAGRSREPLQDGQWEANLYGGWVDLIDEEQDEFLVRYFTEVVCQRLRYTEGVLSASLMLELDPSDIDMLGAFGLYESSLIWQIKSFDLSAESDFPWETWYEAQQSLKPDAPPLRHERETPVGAARRILALYTALVTDLRRAWHAVRIHEKSPKWMESEETLANSPEYERTSRALIDSQSRMPLFTREKIEAVFIKSAWIANLFDVFRLKRLKDALQRETIKNPLTILVDLETRVEKLFDLERADEIQTGQVGEEDRDYRYWAETLRLIGRAFSKDWPVYDDEDCALEEVDIEKHLEGKITNWSLRIEAKDDNEHQRTYAREARNFVWLLSGLAPSLPAIIHTNVMAHVYEAVLLNQIARQHGHDKDAVARITEHFEIALDDIAKWATLVGTLTVSIRYVKIKCLHLFAKLFTETTIRDHPDFTDFDLDCAKFLETCSLKASDDPRTPFKYLYNSVFKPDVAKHLAIMPDVSPSTLLGDEWMIDLVDTDVISRKLCDAGGVIEIKKEGLESRKARKARRDDAHNVHGMFGETEQWLWATNRCLRKLNAKVKEHRVMIDSYWKAKDRTLAQ